LFIVFPRPLSEQDCRAFAFFARRSSGDFPNMLDELAKIRLLIQYEGHSLPPLAASRKKLPNVVLAD